MGIKKNASPLVLGTAQFGSAYGIANAAGNLSQSEASRIVAAAWEGGIGEFDTAQAYGCSEEVVGRALRHLAIAGEARIITKLDPTLDHLDQRSIESAVERSRKTLGAPELFGIMLHREEFLDLWTRGLGETLKGCVQKGAVKHLGVSVYHPECALAALDMDDINLIQIPTNVLDRRFLDAGVFVKARRLKKRLYVRSVFLQGLLLLPPAELPPRLHFARPSVEIVDSLAQECSLSKTAFALHYVRAVAPDAHIVFGAEKISQVSENIESLKQRWPDAFVRRVHEMIPPQHERLINPALWPS